MDNADEEVQWGFRIRSRPGNPVGHVGFSDDGSELGHLPCVDSPESTTWSRIKHTYGD